MFPTYQYNLLLETIQTIYNSKGWYSVLVQAVVDHEYLFRNLNVGWPGGVHDARVFANSSLFEYATAKWILHVDNRTILGCEIPSLLVADSAHPLLPWLLKPYTIMVH